MDVPSAEAPAFAGMTGDAQGWQSFFRLMADLPLPPPEGGGIKIWVPAFAGMTRRRGNGVILREDDVREGKEYKRWVAIQQM